MKIRSLLSLFLCICLAVPTLTMTGCGGDGSSSDDVTTTTGTVTAGSADEQTVPSSAAAVITIPANTTMTDANDQVLNGAQATTVSYSTSTDELPAAARTLPNGCTLAAFLDITIGTAENFTPALEITLDVTPAAAAGETVALYSFNTASNTWEVADTLTVAADGTVSFSVRHLSVWAVFKTATPPPGKPKGISAAAGNGQVTVSWKAPDVGVPTSYNLYYSTSEGVTPGGNGVTAINLTDVSTPTVVKGLTNGTKYYFAVTAVNANGEGGISSEKSATPDANLVIPESPNGVSVTAGSGKVTVIWNTKLTATSYNVYYYAGATTSTTTATVMASGTRVKVQALSADPQDATQTYEVTGLTPGVQYGFSVTAENSAGESAGQTKPKLATPL